MPAIKFKQRLNKYPVTYPKITLKQPELKNEIYQKFEKQLKETINQTHAYKLLQSINSNNILKIKKLYKVLPTLSKLEKSGNINNLQLSIEYIRYLLESKNIKEMSPDLIIKNIERINAGLINSKIVSHENRDVCPNTYTGFFEALENKTTYIIKVNLPSGERTLLAKSYIGTKNGGNKLLLDPNTLEVFSFKTTGGKINNLVHVDNLPKTLKIKIRIMLNSLKKNYYNYYENKTYKNSEQKKKVLNRILEIFSDKNIDSFLK